MSTFFYILLAFIVGVLVGWFIWGRLRGELDSLRGDLDRTRSERDRLRARFRSPEERTRRLRAVPEPTLRASFAQHQPGPEQARPPRLRRLH